MAGEVLEWTQQDSLKGTDFGSLVMDLKEIETQIADLEERKARIRKLILENYKTQLEAGPVRVQDRMVSWRPPTTTAPRLSEKKLILAGVTPDQLEAGKEPGTPRAGYLEVRQLKE